MLCILLPRYFPFPALSHDSGISYYLPDFAFVLVNSIENDDQLVTVIEIIL